MITKNSLKSAIANDIANYISLKQTLGRRFEGPSRVLLDLDRFLLKQGGRTQDLTTKMFEQWCKTIESVTPNVRLSRMRVVRNFCLYRRRTNPNCFIPNPTQFPKARPASQPYIFSDLEIVKILSYSDCIPVTPRSPLRAASTRLAIVLLYTTGLRRGELLRLTAADYNPSTQTLIIRESKFHKSRLLPLPNDVAMEIEEVLHKRKTVRPRLPDNAPLIYSPYCGGRAYSGTQLRKNLHILLNLSGIKKPNGRFPRIHDFRFSFAVNALLRWYRNGEDVQAKLPLLAAYMGHVSVISTHYYLRFVEPLASMASWAFNANYGSLIRET